MKGEGNQEEEKKSGGGKRQREMNVRGRKKRKWAGAPTFSKLVFLAVF